MNMRDSHYQKHPEKREEVQKCNWDHLTECRHPGGWTNAQNVLDSMGLSIVGCIEQTEYQFEKLKEGCKLCLIADLNRNLRLMSVRQS